nr:MAG TPA: hypothetical protein [Bacteriophage sp.]
MRYFNDIIGLKLCQYFFLNIFVELKKSNNINEKKCKKFLKTIKY